MYTMKQACKAVDLPYETLKFYCNEGLVPNVKRGENHYRLFDDNDIQWIENLSCLKKCGMKMTDMKEYLALCLQGEKSIPQRKLMLAKVQKNLEHRKNELQESIEYIDTKKQFYDDVITGRMNYVSNLLPSN